MAIKLTGAFLALISSPANALTTHTAVHRDVEDDRASPACECLGWKAVYERNGAWCGQGHEFSTFVANEGLEIWLAKLAESQETCLDFFLRIEDPVCVNILRMNLPGEWYGGQWCYVDEACETADPANGTAQVKVKTCKPGRDRMLRDMTPDELQDFAEENDLDYGFTAKMAYPVETEATWQKSKQYFNLVRGKSRAQMNHTIANRVQRFQGLKEPIVLSNEDDESDIALMHGSKVIEIKQASDFNKYQPYTKTTAECVHGCPVTEPVV